MSSKYSLMILWEIKAVFSQDEDEDAEGGDQHGPSPAREEREPADPLRQCEVGRLRVQQLRSRNTAPGYWREQLQVGSRWASTRPSWTPSGTASSSPAGARRTTWRRSRPAGSTGASITPAWEESPPTRSSTIQRGSVGVPSVQIEIITFLSSELLRKSRQIPKKY